MSVTSVISVSVNFVKFYNLKKSCALVSPFKFTSYIKFLT